MGGALTSSEASGLVASIPGIAALHAVEPGPRFTYVAVNERAANALGHPAEDLVGVAVTDIFGPGADVQLAAILDRATESRGPIPFTTFLPLADGPVMMDAVLTPYFDDDGEVVQFLWAAVDSSGERAAKEALARSEARFRSLVHNAFDGVGVVDDDARYVWVSPSLDRLMGLEPGTLLGTPALQLVHPDDVLEAMRQLDQTTGATTDDSTWIGRAKHASGEWRILEVQGTDLRNDPNVGGVVLNVRDITVQHEAQAQLQASERQYRRQALHDTLTGLPNRALFNDRLHQALTGLRRREGCIAVLFCDLDGFKWLNDSYGHALGDQVIKEISRRIRHTVRASDTVARFGGDEFLILCTDLDSPERALATADRLTEVVREPLHLEGIDIQLTISVGVAVADRETTQEDQADQVVAQADAARYEAKRAGRNRVCTFDPSLQHRARTRLEVSAQLRRAIEDQQLVVHYQPLIDLAHGGVLQSVEALVRWSHPDRGLLAPAEFIPIAEDTGLMVALGGWVIEEACRQAIAWNGADLPVNVNLSARQLTDPSLPEHVARILATTGLAPERLRLEVTESAVMEDVVDAARCLSSLRELGVRVGIDDFGTGHSALAYLRQLPLDFLKIDRSFVTLLGSNGRDEAIVRAIVDMAHALGLEAVAEGVETATQHAAVVRLGCDVAQGWYLGRPGPPDGDRPPAPAAPKTATVD